MTKLDFLKTMESKSIVSKILRKNYLQPEFPYLPEVLLKYTNTFKIFVKHVEQCSSSKRVSRPRNRETLYPWKRDPKGRWRILLEDDCAKGIEVGTGNLWAHGSLQRKEVPINYLMNLSTCKIIEVFLSLFLPPSLTSSFTSSFSLSLLIHI